MAEEAGAEGAGKRLTRAMRGGAFVALILGLVLYADHFAGFLGDGYWWLVAVHGAIGALAIVAGFAVIGPALRVAGTGTLARRVRSLGLVGVVVLAALFASGIAVFVGALTTGVVEADQLVHLAVAFLAIIVLIAFGLAARPSAQRS